MKFCQRLNQEIDASNPEWVPFWVNFELFKTLIKDLPSKWNREISGGDSIDKIPSEVNFFKHAHAEVEKVSTFFTKAQREIGIRYDRIHDGGKIFYDSKSITATQDKWTLLGRSIFKLHKNLLLLETFAIMNYFAFSRILETHDEQTGYDTKMAFMRNVVNKSNFATYPDVLFMIRGCEAMFDQVSERLSLGVPHGLQPRAQAQAQAHNYDCNSRCDARKTVPAVHERSRTRVVLATEILPLNPRDGRTDASETRLPLSGDDSLFLHEKESKRLRTVSDLLDCATGDGDGDGNGAGDGDCRHGHRAAPGSRRDSGTDRRRCCQKHTAVFFQSDCRISKKKQRCH